jgi:hypothetical protein
MSAFGGKADIIQGKTDIKKCPLMTQSGHVVSQFQLQTLQLTRSRHVIGLAHMTICRALVAFARIWRDRRRGSFDQ